MISGGLYRAKSTRGVNPIRFLQGFRAISEPFMVRSLLAAAEACRGADAVIAAGPAFYAGYPVARQQRLPLIQAYLQPLHPTRAFGSARTRATRAAWIRAWESGGCSSMLANALRASSGRPRSV